MFPSHDLHGVAGQHIERPGLQVLQKGETADVTLICLDPESITDKPRATYGMMSWDGKHTCPSIDGYCGGVLVHNYTGNVVGFHCAKFSNEKANLAVPVTEKLIKVLKLQEPGAGSPFH